MGGMVAGMAGGFGCGEDIGGDGWWGRLAWMVEAMHTAQQIKHIIIILIIVTIITTILLIIITHHSTYHIVLLRADNFHIRVTQLLPPVTHIPSDTWNGKQHCEKLRWKPQGAIHQA